MHTYKKFKPQIWAFIKKSFFGTFRDPWPWMMWRKRWLTKILESIPCLGEPWRMWRKRPQSWSSQPRLGCSREAFLMIFNNHSLKTVWKNEISMFQVKLWQLKRKSKVCRKSTTHSYRIHSENPVIQIWTSFGVWSIL